MAKPTPHFNDMIAARGGAGMSAKPKGGKMPAAPKGPKGVKKPPMPPAAPGGGW